MSEAPKELWADWDYDETDGVCGAHTHKKYASGYEPECPPIRYVRADRIEELEAKLAKAVKALEWVKFGGGPSGESYHELACQVLAELKDEKC